ncbi:type II secretion system F family protein [Eilatimonas milleporae]|uniref:Tight adherence protein C n=1 Tax=Eilatimonas milleporae TaxID=911205 RepID=A0A3M0CSD6_9PROT|nr:type II secretion system F family protein [Eilatimonas milleporae]RMB12501.1 tight adherence protein C [Eilatimonas milleporae]
MDTAAVFAGLSVVDLLSLGAGVTTLLILVAVYQAALVRDPMKGRMKALMERRDMLKAGLMQPKRRTSPIRRANGLDIMHRLANRMKLLQDEHSEKAARKLAQAGLRSRDALVVYQIARLSLPLAMGLTAIILFYGVGILPGADGLHPFFAISLVLAGLKLPDLYVRNTRTKRMSAIGKTLPDALDLMVVCAEAGLTLDAALNRVAGELGKAAPELADECCLTAIELGFLPERRQALENLSARVDLPMVRSVVATLMQSERYGTPLAASLRVLAAEFRNERLMRAEEKAARLPATLTVPLILFILPALFVVLMGPAACKMTEDFINRG